MAKYIEIKQGKISSLKFNTEDITIALAYNPRNFEIHVGTVMYMCAWQSEQKSEYSPNAFDVVNSINKEMASNTGRGVIKISTPGYITSLKIIPLTNKK